jgi:hypothetical protein
MGIVAAAFAGTASIAHATTLGGTFNISVYQGAGGGNINDPQVQANQSNPLISAGNLLGFGTYTGNLDFSQNSTNTIGAFLASGGGTLTGGLTSSTVQNAVLSTAPFATTSVFVITGTTASILAGTVTHDDGASLYDGPGYSNTVFDAAGPVVATPTAYSGLFGNWELIYVEANGLPAVLNFDVTRSEAPSTTPLPAALPLFAGGAGLIGLFSRRRRRRSVTA